MTTPLTPARLKAIAQDFRSTFGPGQVRGMLVAGSGITIEVPGWQVDRPIPLDDIMPFPSHALPGHEHTLTICRRGAECLLVMNGRFHLYQGYTAAEVVAPIRLAGLLGAEVMIATNASGAIDPAISSGSLVIISDHLNLLGANPNIGVWGREFGPQFPDMSAAYDPQLRLLARESATAAGFRVFEGVYAAVSGPSFETPAEIRMLASLGASVVGMSTVPEVIAARHMGMKVLAMSLATNPAAGVTDRELSHEEVLEAGRAATGNLRALLNRLTKELFA
jgi:purine-nucleoside phosphorylase